MIPPKRIILAALSLLLISFLGGSLLVSLFLLVWESTSSGGEDTWICAGGQWVMHGKPSAPKPTAPCGSSARSSAPSPVVDRRPAQPRTSQGNSVGNDSTPLFPPVGSSENGLQAFDGSEHDGLSTTLRSVEGTRSFSVEDFSITFPDWDPVEQAALLEPQSTKVAVTSQGCGIVLTVRPLPQNVTFQAFMQQMLDDQAARAQATLLRRDVGPITTHIEGTFPVGGRIVYSDQYGYLSSKKLLYSLVFVSEKDIFSTVCAPSIDAVVKSIVVR